MTTRIYGFKGDYRWLSNFWEIEDGLTTEHHFQASKATEYADYLYVMDAESAGEAKRRGQKIDLRPDWDEVKDLMMLDLLHEKFSEPVMRARLTATGSVPLIEANSWGDTYWGVNQMSGVGENMLGILLMQVRAEIVLGYV